MNQEDKSYYVLIASNIVIPERVIPAPEVIKGRLEKGYWPLGERTRYRMRFSEGDLVLLYAGSKNSVFVAAARVASPCISPRYEDKMRMEYEWDYLNAFPYGIRLTDPMLFSEPIKAKEIIAEFSFIDDDRRWGVYFQGGVTEIDEADYQLVIRHAAVGA